MDPSGDQTMKTEDGDSVKGDTVQSSIPIQAKQTVKRVQRDSQESRQLGPEALASPTEISSSLGNK